MAATETSCFDLVPIWQPQSHLVSTWLAYENQTACGLQRHASVAATWIK